MTSLPHPPSGPCLTALAALEQDALALPEAVAAHLQRCPTCSEARVLLLSLQDCPEVEVPQGYYAGLSFRILRKLPSRRAGLARPAAFWLAAAGLLAALGLGGTGFFMGRAMRAPMVEASQPKGLADAIDAQVETPFVETEDALTQLDRLNPQQAEEALQRLQAVKPSR
jgi:predicted anti-sigma-YlaC factor YlaD